jgi:hypothetical protein
LATVLQAYVGCSDDEVLEACVMDRRWQLALDCRSPRSWTGGWWNAPSSSTSSRLAGRRQDGLRAALDASPLWGAGRVEDTINLVGHALGLVLGVLGGQQGWGLAAAERARVLADQVGIGVLAGSSVKAALDLDWDDPTARQRALGVVLEALIQVEQLAGALPGGDDPRVAEGLAAARQVRDHDTTPGEDGVARIATGVARDRRISIADAEMRHGRKTRRLGVDGYKRHVLRDLDSELVRVVGLTPANLPEAEVAGHIQAALDAQGVTLGELHIDRAYLASALVRDRAEDLQVFCKAFPVRAPGGRFAKPAFAIDFTTHTLTCPNEITMPFTAGGKVQFPAQTCQACPLRDRCTTSPRGRSVQIHPDERLLVELRARQQTPTGRARLRERTQVEHALAHVGRWQGDRARYLGQRKNLFDLRRVAVVHNLQVIARQPRQTQQAA